MLKSTLLIYDHFLGFTNRKIAVPVIPLLTYATSMLHMAGHPMIPKADAPSRVINYATVMVA